MFVGNGDIMRNHNLDPNLFRTHLSPTWARGGMTTPSKDITDA